jgi:hypothetical protein
MEFALPFGTTFCLHQMALSPDGLTRFLEGGQEFVSYIDAIGELDGQHCLIDWKTTTR